MISFSLIGNNSPEVDPKDSVPEINIDSDMTWRLVQNWRTENSLKTFEIDEKLCVVARDLVNDVNIKKVTFRDKYWNYPYKIGQVSIYNADSPQDVLTEWINATENAEILKKDWKYSCLVCEKRNCAQIFSNFSSATSE